MNYFELKLQDPKDPDLFLEIKGITIYRASYDILCDMGIPDTNTYWDYTIESFQVYENYTPEDIIRHQLKA